jgi:long-subunit acyl-CoA synthetase (AMP-forming)
LVEDDNNMLRNINQAFGNESDQLVKENELLRAEVERYRQFRIPQQSFERPNKRVARSKSKGRNFSAEQSSDEEDATNARVRIFFISKICGEFLLTYVY